MSTDVDPVGEVTLYTVVPAYTQIDVDAESLTVCVWDWDSEPPVPPDAVKPRKNLFVPTTPPTVAPFKLGIVGVVPLLEKYTQLPAVYGEVDKACPLHSTNSPVAGRFPAALELNDFSQDNTVPIGTMPTELPPAGVAQVLSPRRNVVELAVPEPNLAVATVPALRLVAF